MQKKRLDMMKYLLFWNEVQKIKKTNTNVVHFIQQIIFNYDKADVR